MKHIYILVLVFINQSIFSQNFTDTKGQLQISNSGTASYELPIATPPSIKNVIPQISLSYTSGARGGIAGQGWGLNSISAISRIATRRDVDGFIDGVDFDSDDKLSLDGQRLIIKTGTYWANGSVYETEYKSNTKIELKIEGAVTYFIVTAPDGTRSWYGSKGSGSLQNSISINSWYIVHYEDVYGNYIDYNYTAVNYNSTTQLYIDNIVFSGNVNAGLSNQNKITFTYKNSQRIERDFIKGGPIYATKILDNIQVFTNNSLFRKYQLTHLTDTELGYERLSQIQEFNGQSEASNPVVFTYASSPSNQERTEKEYTNTLSFDKTDLAGDFDGDGRLDFVADNKMFTNLFNGTTGNVPISFPSTIPSRLIFSATLLKNNKLNQYQSVMAPYSNITSIQFTSYEPSGGTITGSLVKTISIDNTIFIDPSYMDEDENYIPNIPFPKDQRSNTYLSGDFNGDGVSEALVLSYDDRYAWTEYINPSGYSEGFYWKLNTSENIREVRLVDLNYNTSSADGSNGNVLITEGSSYLYAKGKRYVADMNGDGKSDIISINEYGIYNVIEIKQLNAAPWYEINRLGNGTLSNYTDSKQILFGDYNGDGKTDLMLPTSTGGSNQIEWNIYYSNPNTAGGSFFTKETLNIVEYWPDTGSYYNTQRHFSTYFAMDINSDGKSDLVRVWRKYYKDDWSINNHDTQWQITGFINNIGRVSGSGFTAGYNSGVFYSNSPDIPIPITSNYKYNGANTDLVLVRGHYNKIEYYQFNKNVDTENRLIGISEASGNIKHIIEYKPMEAAGGGLGTPGSDFYSSTNTAMHPNIEIIKNSGSYLVSKLTATINGVSKYQEFRYRSFISNFDYGTVGFTKMTRSNWFLSSSDTKIWTTQYLDTNFRGANTITWSSTNPSTVFDTVPTDLLSTKTNIFNTYINPSSKVYNVLLESQTILDALTGIKSVSSFIYDGDISSVNSYGLQTQNILKKYSGATLQGTSTITTTYDNNPSGAGALYYIGRPKKITTSSFIYTPDTRTSEKTYTYTGFNLTKVEKKGHGTDAIVEEMNYDQVGNLLTKIVSSPTSTPVPASRTNEDQYDSTKRFVVKKTDYRGIITDFIYNNQGQITKSTDYLGIITEFAYDNWGKLITTTVTNKASTPIVTTTTYSRLGDGGYTVTDSKNNGNTTITQFDVLSRPVIATSKGFSVNSWVSRQTVYDGLGRKIRVSEPYYSTPNKWTWYEYDYLQRLTKVTSQTDKIQTIVYNGLTTTTTDDGKVTTATIDALENRVQTTDPGGAINFSYYATGQLKEADYQGNKVTVSIDGWGNKIQTYDPNAGSYGYTYDAYSQVKTETTPNGTISYLYNNKGNLIEKSIVGINTDSKTTYTYNENTNMVSGSTFLNQTDNTSIVNIYEYDPLNRLFKSSEITPFATFIKQITYDTFGRTEKETSTAVAAGKTSSKTIKNVYQNGFPWQIIDDTTQQILWQTNTLSERGEVLTAILGNGISINNTYDQYGYPSQFKYDKTGSASLNILTLNSTFEPKRGNLTNRTNNSFSWNENFTYDELDRLITYKDTQGLSETQTYDTKGKILQNSIGTYNYGVIGKTYQNNSITLTPAALTYYQNRSFNTGSSARSASTTLGGPPPPPSSTIGLEVTYNTFKSPVTIKERGGDETYIDYIDFVYNDGNDRSTMFYGGLDDDKLLRRYRKHYSADGSMEIKEDQISGTVEFITYIGGDGYTAPLIVKSDGLNPQNYYYLHRDYQGSIMSISNNIGMIEEKRLFDAWGAIITVENGNGLILNGLTIIDRGYTGHEHIQSMGLINMNGRLYDPKLHRFLQPDNLVQQLENTQNYNRYGYVLNNPLKYTDPSGEEAITLGVAVIIAAAIAITSYTLNALVADVPFTIGGLVKATFVGAATAVVTFGVGSAVSSLFTSPALGFWPGAFQGAVIGISAGAAGTIANGFFNGNSITLKSVIGGAAIGGLVGGVLGGVQSGMSANKHGLDFWSGEGEFTTSIPLPVDVSTTGDQYLNTADVRQDYDLNIGSKDGITLDQVESKINSTVYMANSKSLPVGYSMDSAGRIFGPEGGQVGGYTYSYNEGNVLFGRSSQIAISPATKGYELALRNMIFKHEFMHAWHWMSGFKGFSTYTERATSSYSLSYVKTYGIDWQETYRATAGSYPSEYSWKNFDKIIPTWLK